jgi:hypothetical protein
MSTPGDLLDLLGRLQKNGVRYILIGGHAVRLQGFLRATENIDLLVPFDEINGTRLISSLDFLESAHELNPTWFSREANEPEIQNIRVADRMLIDILFAANGETFDSLKEHVQILDVEGVAISILDIEGLLKTKTGYREKDLLDRQMLLKLKGA